MANSAACRIRLAGALLASVAFAAGCGGETRVDVYPTSGQVLHRGQPLANALVVLHDARPVAEQQGRPIPRATTDKEGKFQISSYGGADGAPVGEYKVTVFTQGGELEEGEDPEGAKQEPDLLRGRYSNPDTSGLTATIKPGENVLPPFELQ